MFIEFNLNGESLYLLSAWDSLSLWFQVLEFLRMLLILRYSSLCQDLFAFIACMFAPSLQPILLAIVLVIWLLSRKNRSVKITREVNRFVNMISIFEDFLFLYLFFKAYWNTNFYSLLMQSLTHSLLFFLIVI